MLFRSDKFRSFSSRNLFRGAAVLTAAGLITRIMGFFFRIFLSHAFGEENVGLYQLIFPVYALCLSVSTFGIQTAVSHMVAEKMSSVVTYSAPVHPPRILNGKKKPETFLQFLLASHSFSHL